MSAPLQGAKWKIRIDPPTAPADGFQYIGLAQPNIAEADAEWTIIRLTYVSSDISAVDWGEGTTRFIHAWDDRLTINYS